jgi:aryl-alcohol dehydrogenase-like predicted oxidoreductase
VLATKVSRPMGEDPKGRLAALDHDRRRELAAPLADRSHRPLPDPSPRALDRIEETLSALSDVIQSGNVRAIGASHTPAPDIIEARLAG